jgi:hypothetical protein
MIGQLDIPPGSNATYLEAVDRSENYLFYVRLSTARAEL